ncbi:MAG: hypothetical protein Q8835_03540, partial [Sweet potato little leaf phytoplasma]|nr:hypothetical protein [Sweet potato little leaf phytoplasma]
CSVLETQVSLEKEVGIKDKREKLLSKQLSRMKIPKGGELVTPPVSKLVLLQVYLLHWNFFSP